MSDQLNDEQKAAIDAFQKAFPGPHMVCGSLSPIDTPQGETFMAFNGEPVQVLGLLIALVVQVSARVGMPFAVQPLQVKPKPGVELMR